MFVWTFLQVRGTLWKGLRKWRSAISSNAPKSWNLLQDFKVFICYSFSHLPSQFPSIAALHAVVMHCMWNNCFLLRDLHCAVAVQCPVLFFNRWLCIIAKLCVLFLLSSWLCSMHATLLEPLWAHWPAAWAKSHRHRWCQKMLDEKLITDYLPSTKLTKSKIEVYVRKSLNFPFWWL